MVNNIFDQEQQDEEKNKIVPTNEYILISPYSPPTGPLVFPDNLYQVDATSFSEKTSLRIPPFCRGSIIVVDESYIIKTMIFLDDIRKERLFIQEQHVIAVIKQTKGVRL